MTPSAEILMRNRVASGLAGPAEICAAMAIAARSLASAMNEWDLEAMERHACFIRDTSAWLQKNPTLEAL